MDQPWTSARGLAQRVLVAVALGQSAEAKRLAGELAAAVLADEAVQLAVAVQAGGEHGWRRAVELAAVVCGGGVERERRERRASG